MTDLGLTVLIANAALLLAMAAALDLAVRRGLWSGCPARQWLVGLLLGAIAVAVMLVPFQLLEGVVYDVRSVVVGLAGLYFGTVPTLVATAVAVAFRGWLGGVGTGVGIATLVASAAIGLLWRRWRPVDGAARGWRELLAFGLVVHLAIAAVQMSLPRDVAVSFLVVVAPMMLTLYPLLTMAIGLLLERRVASARTLAHLEESEARFRSLFEDSHAIMLVIDPIDGRIVDANQAAAEYYGWSRDELMRMRIDQINTLTPAEIHAAMERARATGGRSFGFRHRRADGQVREVEVYCGPIRHGERDLLYSLIVDVHDRRQAETQRVAQAVEATAAQSADLERQRRARIAALNLAEDAVVARRRAEAAHRDLSASETRYRLLFHANPQPMWVYDLETYAFLEVNDAAIQKYGFGRDEFLRMTLVDIRPAEEVPRLLEQLGRDEPAFTTSGVWRHQTKAGESFDVDILTHAMEFEGRPARLAQAHDVTAMRRAEFALRDSEERLRLLAEHAPAALALFDRDLRFLAVSRRWLRDHGLEDTAVHGRHYYEVVPEVPERYREANRRALGGEVLGSDGEPIARPDGRGAWLRWEVRPWYGVDGAVGGIVVFTEDISEVVRAREEVNKLSRAVEQSPESIVITDLDGSIEYVNQAFVDASGFDRDEVLGKDPRILQSGKTPVETYRQMWANLTAGEVWEGEFVNRRKNGEEYVEHATISPLAGVDGRTTHYVAVKEDVTTQRRISEELDQYRNQLEDLVVRRTAELEKARASAVAASEAKSEFLANMSHEIRTPLNAVVGLTHLLLRDAPTPQQAERLRRVRSSASHLLAIVSDILDLAKIEAGMMVIDERDFHLSAVLDQVGSMVSQTAREKGLELEVDRDAVPEWLRGDPVRLRQALLNLAGNAVKFTEQGSVHMSAKLLDDTAGGLLRVRFEVRDTGIGIPNDLLPHLFDTYEQGDMSVSRKYGGTGLGLPIVRRLAELMSGTVGVESEVGRGTRTWFEVTLRRGQSVVLQVEEPLGRDDNRLRLLAGAKVLLADDHAINREVAAELLSGFGLEVASAENGRVAVEMAAREAYDLIVMDVHMPELDGLEATRAIRAMAGYEQVPILAMTANVFEDDRQACFAAGMDDFVSKPVDPGFLRSAVTKWLLRHRDRRGVSPLSPPDGRAPETRPGEEDAPVDDPLSPFPPSLDWPGLDRGTAVDALGGDVERYLTLLRRFATAHADDARRLASALGDGDVEAARQRAHGLKGVAGTLGATALQVAAAEIEAALREHRPTDAALEDLRRELDELRARLEGIGEADATPRADAAVDAKAALARIRSLLATDDPRVLDAYDSVGDQLRALIGPEAVALGAEIQAFDFARARERIDRLSPGARPARDEHRP